MDTSTIVMMMAAVITLAVVYSSHRKLPEGSTRLDR